MSPNFLYYAAQWLGCQHLIRGGRIPGWHATNEYAWLGLMDAAVGLMEEICNCQRLNSTNPPSAH
jgi:hypothetical protein